MINEKTIGIAILGCGTVGTGVYELIGRQESNLENKTGFGAQVCHVLVRDAKKPREGIPAELLTESFEEIVNDPCVDIVVEVMGGIEPAKTYITAALQAGKHVVTANKDLMSNYCSDLQGAAREKGCDLLFEAAVAGGVPIIRPMKQCLAGNEIDEVFGILNGTTNYILTKMTEEGMEFGEALAKATELGYAEADPTADIEGLDAGRKIAILASLAFHSSVKFPNVYTEGITKISAADIKYGKEMGRVIKLLGIARQTETGIEASVQPMLISANHPLASVNDVYNAVFVHGDAVDNLMFYGRGAGRYPTASACMGDIIDIMRNIKYHSNGRIGSSCYRETPIKEMGQSVQKYFLRLRVADRPGVLAAIASVMGQSSVSIQQLIQKPTRVENTAELVLITDFVVEADFMAALNAIRTLPTVTEVCSMIRVMG